MSQPSEEQLKLAEALARQSGEQIRQDKDGHWQLSKNFECGWAGYGYGEEGLSEMIGQLAWEAEHIERKRK